MFQGVHIPAAPREFPMSAMLLPPLAALMIPVQAVMALTEGWTAYERRIDLRSSHQSECLVRLRAICELRAATRALAFSGPGMRARRRVPWGRLGHPAFRPPPSSCRSPERARRLLWG